MPSHKAPSNCVVRFSSLFSFLVFQFSSFLVFQFSIFQFSSFLVFQFSSFLLFQFSSFLVFQFSSFLVFQFSSLSSFLTYLYSFLGFQFSSFLVLKMQVRQKVKTKVRDNQRRAAERVEIKNLFNWTRSFQLWHLFPSPC